MSSRILVVDDNPLNLKLLEAKLSHEYYIVSTAENGLKALEKIEKEKPDLILLDVMMPELDGFETCRRIKSSSSHSHIPVVMVTALSDASDRVKGLEAGADDFITKPINDMALMARVRSLLRLKMIMDEWRVRESIAGQVIASDLDRTITGEPVVKKNALLLTDNPLEQKFILESMAPLGLHITVAGTVTQAIALALEGDYSLVIADLDLQGDDGLKICPQIRANEQTRQLPILLIANNEDMPKIAKGLDLGVNDYIIRPLDAGEILARARTQLKQKDLYDRLRRNYEEGLSLALVDQLTNLFNRRYLDTRLPKAITRAQQDGKPLSILMIDIDHFKAINDTYGHAAGDQVLKEVSKIIMDNLRPFDMVARMGGEEFIVVMPDARLSAATNVGERLRKKVETTGFKIDGGKSISATISIGATEISLKGEETIQSIQGRADKNLYKAKQSGRNRVVAE